jgi:hypothetical protein
VLPPTRRPPAAQRRRRSGDGPGEGCARRPVGTCLYLHAVGAGNHVAVPGLARWGHKQGTGGCDPRDHHVREAIYGGFWKIIIPIHQHRDFPLGFFVTKYSEILSRQGDGGWVCEMLFGEDGYGWISGGTRVLELAADSREAALGHGAR